MCAIRKMFKSHDEAMSASKALMKRGYRALVWGDTLEVFCRPNEALRVRQFLYHVGGGSDGRAL